MYLAHTPSPPSAEGGGSSAERMVEEPLSLCGNALLNRKAIYRGSFLGKTQHKASPERGGARRRRAEGFVHRSPTPHVRGGSVSRRGLIPPFNGEHPYFSGGTKPEETTTPNASRSSGGSAREGLLSEKPPPSHPPFFRSLPDFALAKRRGLWQNRGEGIKEGKSWRKRRKSSFWTSAASIHS